MEDSYAGRDWGQEEKRTTEDEMVGWHQHLTRNELNKFRQLLMDRDT